MIMRQRPVTARRMSINALLTNTLVLKLAYDGKHFSGFQQQDGQRTVAGELQRALRVLTKKDPEITCAGRTDAGVHAEAQYVSIPCYAEQVCNASRVTAHDIPKSHLVRSLNALTPDDIVIKAAYRADAQFSARFSALSRSYIYRFGNSRECVLMRRYCALTHHKLDVFSMNEAAEHLVGEHDFSSFCKPSTTKDKNRIRNILVCSVKQAFELGEPCIQLNITATAFLHNMVRIIAGTLLEIGQGAHSASKIISILNARDRQLAGRTAPACGLTFSDVCYAEDSFLPWCES